MKRRRNTFYCFSPPVMVATMVIEVGLLIGTVWRYKFNPVTRLVALTLASLAVFQMAEFMVCKGPAHYGLQWSRAGYVAITMLPPLGLHLVFVLGRARRKWVLLPMYATALGFMLFFAFVGNALMGQACLGNYVIFEVRPGAGIWYGVYYYGWLLATLSAAWYFARHTKPRHLRRAFAGLAAGYAAFLLPTATVTVLSPGTLRGIPSIMCGFAVLLALALAFVVVPASMKEYTRRK